MPIIIATHILIHMISTQALSLITNTKHRTFRCATTVTSAWLPAHCHSSPATCPLRGASHPWMRSCLRGQHEEQLAHLDASPHPFKCPTNYHLLFFSLSLLSPWPPAKLPRQSLVSLPPSSLAPHRVHHRLHLTLLFARHTSAELGTVGCAVIVVQPLAATAVCVARPLPAAPSRAATATAFLYPRCPSYAPSLGPRRPSRPAVLLPRAVVAASHRCPWLDHLGRGHGQPQVSTGPAHPSVRSIAAA
jgi:hypothetical protein